MTSTLFPSRFAGLLALVGVAILLDQAGLVVAALYPWSPDNLQWRFGAMVLLIGRTTPILVADALLIGWALLAERRLAVRGLAILHAVLAGLLVLGTGLFVLDALQVRPLLPFGVRRQALLTTVRVGTMATLLTITALWLAVRLFRGSRPSSLSKRTAQRPLIVPTGTDAA